MKKKKNKCLGPTLESFLKKEGIFDEVQVKALKTSISLQIKEAMEKQSITQTELANKMGTSRAVLQRLLNPQNYSVTLTTLHKAANAIGKELCIHFE